MNLRKQATDEAVKLIEMLLPGSPNGQYIRERLDAMTDEQFSSYMDALSSGEEILPLIAPNLSDMKLSVGRNLEVAKALGHQFFEHLWLTDASTNEVYRTPIKYLVVDLPVRRQQQLLQKKIKIPVDTRHVDELTGQPRDESKGSSISFPEIQVLSAQTMDHSLVELLKFFGGDEKARLAAERAIVQTGHVKQEAIMVTNSRPKSTQTLSSLLKGMHLDNNL